MSDSKPPAIANDGARPDLVPSSSSSGENRLRKAGHRQGQGKRAPFPARQKSSFTARCPELKGHVFDTSQPKQIQAESYLAAVKELQTYVGTNCLYGDNVVRSLKNLDKFDIPRPTAPSPDSSGNVDSFYQQIYELKVKQYGKRMGQLKENLGKAFHLIWGQCSNATQAKLEVLQDYSTIKAAADSIGLLKAIKNLQHEYRAEKHPVEALHSSRRLFYLTRQDYMTSQAYYERFQANNKVVEAIGGSIRDDPALSLAVLKEWGIDPSVATEDQNRKAKEEGREWYFAVAFLLNVDRRRYGHVIEDVQQQYLYGNDIYPQMLVATYNLITNSKVKNRGPTAQGNDGVAFTNVDQKGDQDADVHVSTGARRDKSHIMCYNCGDKGHYANECKSDPK